MWSINSVKGVTGARGSVRGAKVDVVFAMYAVRPSKSDML